MVAAKVQQNKSNEDFILIENNVINHSIYGSQRDINLDLGSVTTLTITVEPPLPLLSLTFSQKQNRNVNGEREKLGTITAQKTIKKLSHSQNYTIPRNPIESVSRISGGTSGLRLWSTGSTTNP